MPRPHRAPWRAPVDTSRQSALGQRCVALEYGRIALGNHLRIREGGNEETRERVGVISHVLGLWFARAHP